MKWFSSLNKLSIFGGKCQCHEDKGISINILIDHQPKDLPLNWVYSPKMMHIKFPSDEDCQRLIDFGIDVETEILKKVHNELHGWFQRFRTSDKSSS